MLRHRELALEVVFSGGIASLFLSFANLEERRKWLEVLEQARQIYSQESAFFAGKTRFSGVSTRNGPTRNSPLLLSFSVSFPHLFVPFFQ